MLEEEEEEIADLEVKLEMKDEKIARIGTLVKHMKMGIIILVELFLILVYHF